MVRSDMLKWLDEEEEKVLLIANQEEKVVKTEVDSLTGEVIDVSNIITYEDYYGTNSIGAEGVEGGEFGAKKTKGGKISFEEFVKEQASENIFDNDLLEQQYKFWES